MSLRHGVCYSTGNFKPRPKEKRDMAELKAGGKFNVAVELLGNQSRLRGDKVAIYCG